ncbi:MAG: hypothetical protein HOB18_05025 [Nitrospina sp.]|nr:hypothetical protein [Nitrospina sp.]
MQTYPIRKSTKSKSQYLFPAIMLAITALLISAVSSMAVPDPLGNSIQKHMEESRKSH